MTTKASLERVGAFSGVLASVLLIIGGGLTDINPIVDVTAPSANIANVFIENQTELLAGTYLSLLGVFALIWFLAYLREFLLGYRPYSTLLAKSCENVSKGKSL